MRSLCSQCTPAAAAATLRSGRSLQRRMFIILQHECSARIPAATAADGVQLKRLTQCLLVSFGDLPQRTRRVHVVISRPTDRHHARYDVMQCSLSFGILLPSPPSPSAAATNNFHGCGRSSIVNGWHVPKTIAGARARAREKDTADDDAVNVRDNTASASQLANQAVTSWVVLG